MKILLNTAIKRLMSSIFATSKYVDITTTVIQRPVWHASIPGSSPQGGSIESAKTCKIFTPLKKFVEPTFA